MIQCYFNSTQIQITYYEKVFINNGNWLTGALTLFFVMTDVTRDYLPKFSNWYLTMATYLLIVLLPVTLSIYYRNKK